ncbi:CTP synthase C-terminal region-related (seleno)protein [Gynuella sp.]|uniref:CTP synthase C-terminal region-related (seleno)protein n=1 Tax=Gynuella sp. TaxID=2969146 RepID=UPI003D0DE269
METSIALVGDYSEHIIAHQAINQTFELLTNTDFPAKATWVGTETITSAQDLNGYNGIWLVPGSPYQSLNGALTAIQHARTKGIPYFGSCAGFQHAIMEYCANVLGWEGVTHEEINETSQGLEIISKLSCSLMEESEQLLLSAGSILARAYQAASFQGTYHCNYGLNPTYREQLFDTHLTATAFNEQNDIRAFELANHPFFVATLFQPERSALQGQISPIIQEFIKASANT